MWNTNFCSFGSLFGSGHWFPGGIVPLLFMGLIIWAMIGLLQKLFSTKAKQNNEALEIVKRRYAAGEISQEQFEEMKYALKRS